MNPTQQQQTLVSWPDPQQVFGVCDYCGTPDRARVLVTDQDGSNPRLVCADDVVCAGAQRITMPTTGADGYVVTDHGLAAVAEAEADAAEEPGAAFVLRSAARYLQRYGWIQGAYYDATSQVFTPAACMVGAIGMVCYGGPVEAPAQMYDDPGYLDFEEAVLHLDRYLMVEDSSESYEFNDAKGRRIEDVLAALRKAATVPAEELIDALHAANWCARCYSGCCSTDNNGAAEPDAGGHCGCRCHRNTDGGDGA